MQRFIGSIPETIGLPIKLIDYFELVDWNGRMIIQDKRRAIEQALPLIMEAYPWTNLNEKHSPPSSKVSSATGLDPNILFGKFVPIISIKEFHRFVQA